MIHSVHRHTNDKGGCSVTPSYYTVCINPRDWFHTSTIELEQIPNYQIPTIEENLYYLSFTRFKGRVKWFYMFHPYSERMYMNIRFTRRADATYFKLTCL